MKQMALYSYLSPFQVPFFTVKLFLQESKTDFERKWETPEKVSYLRNTVLTCWLVILLRTLNSVKHWKNKPIKFLFQCVCIFLHSILSTSPDLIPRCFVLLVNQCILIVEYGMSR